MLCDDGQTLRASRSPMDSRKKAGNASRLFILLNYCENGYFFLTALFTGLTVFFAGAFFAARVEGGDIKHRAANPG